MIAVIAPKANRVGVTSRFNRTALVAASFFLVGASGIARADVNDTIFQAIQDFCIKGHKSVDAAARFALKSPFQPRDMGTEKGPPYGREIGLHKLAGASIVTFMGPSRNAPPNECLFVSYSDDLAGLLARMKAAFALSEPVENTLVYNGWRSSGSVAVTSRAAAVKLDYSLQDNKKAGSFNLRIAR